MLWFIAVLFLAALGASFVNQVEVRSTIYLEEKTRAYFLAREGLAQAEQELSQQWADHRPWLGQADGTWRSTSNDQGQIRYKIRNEQGKLNLNRITAPVLNNALSMLGLASDEAAQVGDAILDWVDQDALRRANGAEADYYRRLDPSYQPPNGPIQNPGELCFIRGINSSMLFGLGPEAREMGLEPGVGLWDIFTVYTRDRRVDVNSASYEVLMSLPEIDEDTVLRILEARRRGPFMSLTDVRREIGDTRYRRLGPLLTVTPSRAYTIVSEGTVTQGRGHHVMMAVVRIMPAGRIERLFWVDDLFYTPPEHKAPVREDADIGR
ncbi:MAG: general secretion pathway protein GspK [Deltaproteobacteria bacterium]|nr:general secretion pathway protein GspK [Deltaproteobacteria bacterium]